MVVEGLELVVEVEWVEDLEEEEVLEEGLEEG